MGYIAYGLTAILALLKMIELTPAVAAMSWWVVFAPTLIWFAILTFFLIIFGIFAALASK